MTAVELASLLVVVDVTTSVEDIGEATNACVLTTVEEELGSITEVLVGAEETDASIVVVYTLVSITVELAPVEVNVVVNVFTMNALFCTT